ncbi:MAG: pyruvate kinase, partial [Candidatus Omnitrophota bacterium]
MVKTKIICTLGPASSNETVIRKMMIAGMDVGRINFSHGKSQELIKRINLIRLVNTKYRRRVKLLGDLQGHRIRIGDLTAPVLLKKNKLVWLSQQNIKGTQTIIPFDYQGPLSTIKNVYQIFIDDGNIALEVVGRGKDKLKAKVIIGGLLKKDKGINIPDAKLEFGEISQKDIQDILFCEKNKFEYIAQSFVCSKKDILALRKVLPSKSQCQVIAKIENREGIKNIDEIIKASDGIMIARGDMGVSLPIYEIPIIQKMIIEKCNRAKKIVITATQMLDSMTENLRPTRAEVTDVANAIIDGTDFVMLSAESAV